MQHNTETATKFSVQILNGHKPWTNCPSLAVMWISTGKIRPKCRAVGLLFIIQLWINCSIDEQRNIAYNIKKYLKLMKSIYFTTNYLKRYTCIIGRTFESTTANYYYRRKRVQRQDGSLICKLKQIIGHHKMKWARPFGKVHLKIMNIAATQAIWQAKHISIKIAIPRQTQKLFMVQLAWKWKQKR